MGGARIRAGLMHWPLLARAAGLPVEGWQATLLWSREDARGDRTVIRLDRQGHAPVVVKQAHHDGEAPGMAAGIAAQARAAQALQDHPTARVPRILAHLPDRRAALIEAVPGVPLADMGAEALIRAGLWLDAFHRTGPLGTGPFWPIKAARRAFHAAAQLDAGSMSLPKPRRFLSHVRSLKASAPALRGTVITTAPRHGDFSGRNLLIGEAMVWGIDFGRERTGATGFDIAKLLTFLAVRGTGPASGLLAPGSGSLPSAFFHGYSVTGQDDPIFPFLMRAALLADWAALPPEPDMTSRQAARLRRIRALLADLAPGT